MTAAAIREKLFSMQDLKYRDFSASLMPTVDKRRVIGVRTPVLKAFAKELIKSAYLLGEFSDIDAFFGAVPHEYFEENNLHAFLISEIKDFELCIRKTEEFLPYVDNWATCDSFRPKCFRKNTDELLPYINRWLKSEKTYTVRFAIELLMVYFLDEHFSPVYPDSVSKIRSDEYYVNMMIAWYFATALAKQYESVISYIEKRKLSKWIHNKSIQKSVESFRITAEQKEHLASLRVKICK